MCGTSLFLTAQLEELKGMDKVPHLAIIRVGERPDDMSYERGATKKMEKVGFDCTSYTFPADIDNETFQRNLTRLMKMIILMEYFFFAHCQSTLMKRQLKIELILIRT